MTIELFDCTIRDGGSVVGGGTTVSVAVTVVEGLIASGLTRIEIGNTYSMGEAGRAKCAPGTPTDDEYLAGVQPYVKKAGLGMFVHPAMAKTSDLEKAKANGLTFVRIGSNVGSVRGAAETIKAARDFGLETRFSLMKSYAATAEQLADDARAVVDMGAQIVHVMDSTGSFFPDEVSRYFGVLRQAVKEPLGFHGHNNLGLAVANAIAAHKAGVNILDCSVGGYARSAGNAPTEMLAVVFDRLGIKTGVDVFGLLDFIEKKGAPALNPPNCVAALDVVFGMAGFHSSFAKTAKAAAEKRGVSLHRLICEVCKIDKVNPSDALFAEVAEKL